MFRLLTKTAFALPIILTTGILSAEESSSEEHASWMSVFTSFNPHDVEVGLTVSVVWEIPYLAEKYYWGTDYSEYFSDWYLWSARTRFGVSLLLSGVRPTLQNEARICLENWSEFVAWRHSSPGHNSRIYDGLISTDPDQWDEETRHELFGNMPPEYHQRYVEAYKKWHETWNLYWQTRAELFKVIHPLFTTKEDEEYFNRVLQSDYAIAAERQILHECRRILNGIWSEFHRYPQWLNPHERAAYWKTLAEEILFYCDKRSEIIQQKTEEQKNQIMEFQRLVDTVTLADLPYDLKKTEFFANTSHLYNYFLANAVPLNDEQKLQILDDKPLSVSGQRYNFYRGVKFAADEFLKEARDAEREPWKIDATPELTKLGITQEEVDRWDGSLSLHPFIRTIAVRSEGIDMERLQTTINQMSWGWGWGAGSEITLSNTHPALMQLLEGKKDVVFSARELSKAELDAIENWESKQVEDRRKENEEWAKQVRESLGEHLPKEYEEDIKNLEEQLRNDLEEYEKSIEEWKAERRKTASELVLVPFAKDAFVFLQNRQNPVRDLTLEQYQGIFSGKYRRWKQVGGFGGNVVPFIRNVGSGSEELIQTLVMQDIVVHRNFKPQILNSMSWVFEALENTPTGIAYSIYHYDRYMVFNANTRVMAVNGVFPNADTIASGEYPLVYECVLLHRKEPGERVERFVEWLLSDEGQRLVRSIGYVPIRAIE